MATSEKTLVIGMGDTLRGDGGVGIAVIRQLCARLGDGCPFDLLELETGGIRLMEVMEGYNRAFIVDAMITGAVPPGTIRPIALTDSIATSDTPSTCDTDLGTDVEMGRLLGLQIPETIRVWGIEAADLNASGSLSERVRAAVPRMVEELLQATTSEQDDSESGTGASGRSMMGDENARRALHGSADHSGSAGMRSA